MTDPRTLANALLEDLDNNGLPGSPIRYQGEEIWLHTTGQVEGWLRTHLEKAGLIEAVEDNWTAPAPSSPGQVDPEPATPVRIDSLIQRVADGEQITVSNPGWNDGKPVDLVELHPRFAGDTEVRYGVRGVFALINATVPADFLVTPA